MKRRYKNFITEYLLESILHHTSNFFYIINSIQNDKIADYLSNVLLYEKDIRTQFNYLDISDEDNDDVSFIPDNQYQKSISDGINPKDKKKSFAKIGRLVGQILKSNDFEFTTHEMEKFVNAFKSKWDEINQPKDIKIVSGEDIRYWYLGSRYYSNKSTLGNSCMRYSDCQNFLDIYVKNPDKIRMIISLESGKLKARCLVWKLDDDSYFIDRIYTNEDQDIIYLRNWAEKNIKGKLLFHPTTQKIKCTLKYKNFELYPYLDNMCYLYQELNNGVLSSGGFICNYSDNVSKNYLKFYLTSTNGESECSTHRYSKTEEIWIIRSDAVYIDYLDGYISLENAVYSNRMGEYYRKTECVWSEYLKSWILENKSINHKKFGIVDSRLLVKLLVDYVGIETDPILIADDIINNPDLLKLEDVVIEDMSFYGNKIEDNILKLITRSDCKIFVDKEKYIMTSFLGSGYHKLFYKARDINDNKYGIELLTDLDSNIIFGEVNNNRIFDIRYDIYARGFKYMIVGEIYDMIKKSNLSEDEKSQQIKKFKSIHNYLMRTYNIYKVRNTFVEERGNIWINLSNFVNSLLDLNEENEVLFKNKYIKLGLFIFLLYNNSWYDGLEKLNQIIRNIFNDNPDRILLQITSLKYSILERFRKIYDYDILEGEYFKFKDIQNLSDEEINILKKLVD